MTDDELAIIEGRARSLAPTPSGRLAWDSLEQDALALVAEVKRLRAELESANNWIKSEVGYSAPE